MTELRPWERVLVRLLPLILAITVAAVGGLAALVQSSDDDIDDLGDSVTSVEESTRRVERFVDDLEEQTPDELAQQAAVTAAVQQVPEIREILCQAFPDVPACAAG